MERIFDWLDRMLGTPAGWPTPEEGVTYWQSRVLDVAMVVAVILGTLSVVPGVIRALAEANYILLVADIAVLVIALGVLLARAVAYRVRAGMLVVAAFGIGLVQVATSGLHTPGPLWLFAGPVMAAILFNLRTAMALVAVVALLLVGQVGLGHLGLLPPALAAEVGTPRWVEVATDLVLLSSVVSLFMGVLLRGLRTTLARVQRVSGELEAERAALLETNRELKQQMERRRRAEEERAWLASAMEQAEDAVAIMELDGDIRYVNRAFQRLFGRSPESLLGRPIADVGAFTDQPAVEDAFRALERDEVWTGRLTGRREGTEWTAQVSLSTLRDGDGRPSHRLAVIRDVSREAELETQLQQAQKLEAIGTFAGGIAHDFNNLLVPILGTADLLQDQVDGDARELLQDVLRSAHRGRELVSQILAFSRGGERRRTVTYLGDAVTESDRLLRASLPANIELEYAIEDRGLVHVSEAEVQQVLMNLCTNAFHAMRRDGGRLRIAVDRVTGAAVDTWRGVAVAPLAPDQEYVRLTVSDTGEGMDEDTLGRVFEPFFTTKATGQGTGLGLAMVHGVARAADGTLVIRSDPGVGTTVDVLLPQEAAEPAESDDRAVVEQHGAGQRVLVIDDEEPVRTVTGRFLARLNYRPVLLDPEAGRRFLEAGEHVDLLITDLSMPGITGLQLGRLARGIYADLPMVLCTGLVDQATMDSAREAGFDDVLAKPFGKIELSETIARALGPNAAAPAG